MALFGNISGNLSEAPQLTAKMRGELNNPGVKRVMGRSIAQTLKEHFYDLDAKRANAMGGKRTHFYADAAKGVQQPRIESDGLAVDVNKLGLRLRYFGGTVRPGKSKSWKTGRPTQWLAVPASVDAYGRRTQEFDFSAGGAGNLRFVFFRPGLAGLVENLSTVITRTNKGVYKPVRSTIGAVVFWLKKSLTYKADPSVFPEERKMTGPAFSAAGQYLGRLWERKGWAS